MAIIRPTIIIHQTITLATNINFRTPESTENRGVCDHRRDGDARPKKSITPKVYDLRLFRRTLLLFGFLRPPPPPRKMLAYPLLLWLEISPFVSGRVLRAAERLSPDDSRSHDFPRNGPEIEIEGFFCILFYFLLSFFPFPPPSDHPRDVTVNSEGKTRVWHVWRAAGKTFNRRPPPRGTPRKRLNRRTNEPSPSVERGARAGRGVKGPDEVGRRFPYSRRRRWPRRVPCTAGDLQLRSRTTV